jgi:hypothetical protein
MIRYANVFKEKYIRFSTSLLYCAQNVSLMKRDKTSTRLRMTDEHLSVVLRSVISALNPDIEKFFIYRN